MLLVRKPKHDMYGNAGYNDHYKRDHHDVNANNNAFILNEEEEKQQQRYIKDHYSNKDQAADNNNEREHDTHVNDSNDDDYRDQRYSNHKTNKQVMILFKMKQESFKKKKITIHTNINNMIYKSDGIPKLIPSLLRLISTIWIKYIRKDIKLN